VERSSGAAPPPQPGGSDLNGGAPDLNGSAPLDVRIVDSRDGATIVALAGELDLSTIPRMEGPLLEQVRQRPAVVLDLSDLSFIDSSGIGILIKASQQSNGTPMRVVIGPGSQVERIFRIAGIEKALRVFVDRDEALGELAPSARGNGDGTG
jgi:anti-sigma B factor antagonist